MGGMCLLKDMNDGCGPPWDKVCRRGEMAGAGFGLFAGGM